MKIKLIHAATTTAIVALAWWLADNRIGQCSSNFTY